MQFRIRYKFWHVMVVLIGIVMIYFIRIGLITMLDRPVEITEPKPLVKGETKDEITWFGSLSAFVFFAALIYFALNHYYNLILANKKRRSFLKATAWMVVASYLYHLIVYYINPWDDEKGYDTPGQVFITMLAFMIPILLFSYGFAYFTHMREAVKQRRVLQEQKLQLEAQISQANFNFLKSQINPHFLHNTLNFLYSKSLPYSTELSEGILTLSDIMRYALRQGNQIDGKTLLKDEIEHVNNVIKINQLRYSNRLEVIFKVIGNVEGKMIIPFVLITLVENAFKHGDLQNPDYPVEIKVDVNAYEFYFYCRNRKKSGPKQLSTGIGLENIKDRLKLAYGENYKYVVNEEQDSYTVELTIDKL